MKTDIKQEVNAPINVMASLPVVTNQKPEFKLGLEPEKLVGGLKPAFAPNLYLATTAIMLFGSYFVMGFSALKGLEVIDPTLYANSIVLMIYGFIAVGYAISNRVSGNKENLIEAKETSQKLAELVLNSQDLKDGIAGLVEAIEQRQKSAKEQFNELSKQSGHLQEKLVYTRVAEQYAALAGEIKNAKSIADIADVLGMVKTKTTIHLQYYTDSTYYRSVEITSDTTKQVMEVTEDLMSKNYDKLLAVADKNFAVENFTKRLDNAKIATLRSGLLQDRPQGAKVV